MAGEMPPAGPGPDGSAWQEVAPSGPGLPEPEPPASAHSAEQPDSPVPPLREVAPLHGTLAVREARPLDPYRVAQPVAVAQPVEVAQPVAVAQPVEVAQPVAVAQPVEVAQRSAGPGPRKQPASPSIRSAERRRWCADLLGPDVAGLVLHGPGGIGKSVLATEIVARAGRLEPDRLTVLLRGEVSADTFLARLASALRRHPVATTRGGARALVSAGRTDLSWAHRLELFRDHVLGQVPVLVELDDFDDNLSARPAKPAIEDPALAGLLADLAGEPGLARLLITCRNAFLLPGTAGQALGLRSVGPLSPSGAARLAASLPALGLLDEPDIGTAWRLTGGHPRTMEYLDALLSGSHADFGEVAERLAVTIQARTGQAVLGRAPGAPGAPAGGSPAELEKIALAAADVLLGELCDRLSPDARDLLTGASVYREPVGSHVLLLPAGQPRQAAALTGLVAECAAAGLLAADYSSELPSVFVHRWTASELHRRRAREQRGEEVADAHRRAAEYWRWRISSWPHDRHALREASYHLLRAGDQGQGGHPRAGRGTVRRRLTILGAAALAVAVAAGVTAVVIGALPGPALAPGRPAGGAPASAADTLASRSAAVRGQAAAWVAQQVSRDAIVACDPAMCAALQAHGIPPGNLLVLRPSATDPLGSDLVMATPAVRSQFGRRLASVYAPVVIASFGSGGLRIDVRTVAPDGAAAYRTALAADLAARRGAGQQLLRNPRIGVSAAARSDLAAGRVDTRLLLTLAAVASVEPVRVASFTDSGPGAAPGVPLRAVELTVPAQGGARPSTRPSTRPGAGPGTYPGARPRPRAGAIAGTHARARSSATPHNGPGAALRKVLAFVRAQRPPYRPAWAGIVRGPWSAPLLSMQFGAPSPTGLIQGQPLLHRDTG